MILAKKTSIARPVLRHKEYAGLRNNLNLGVVLCPSHNSGYAVQAEYRPHPNCPMLRFGQLRIAANVIANGRTKNETTEILQNGKY